MKVKIIKCSNDEFWYRDQVGAILNVGERDINGFEVPINGDKYIRTIHISDLEILPDETPQPEPFDLERALNGEKVVNRRGEPVTSIFHFEGATKTHYCVGGVCDGYARFYTKDGFYTPLNGECQEDLFMAPKEPRVVTKWVNVYGHGTSCSDPYDSYNEAIDKNIGCHGCEYIGTFPIQITLP
jgi:hypothetical protein